MRFKECSNNIIRLNRFSDNVAKNSYIDFWEYEFIHQSELNPQISTKNTFPI